MLCNSCIYAIRDNDAVPVGCQMNDEVENEFDARDIEECINYESDVTNESEYDDEYDEDEDDIDYDEAVDMMFPNDSDGDELDDYIEDRI